MVRLFRYAQRIISTRSTSLLPWKMAFAACKSCKDGWTSLTTGIFWNMHGSVRLLLDKGAGTLVVTDQGETLLHVAVKYGDIKMLEMLAGRDLGALDLDAKTGAGETVYAIAKARDESSDWQKAFHALLESIRDRKSDSKPQADKIADGEQRDTCRFQNCQGDRCHKLRRV
jgi:hypothetical protein